MEPINESVVKQTLDNIFAIGSERLIRAMARNVTNPSQSSVPATNSSPSLNTGTIASELRHTFRPYSRPDGPVENERRLRSNVPQFNLTMNSGTTRKTSLRKRKLPNRQQCSYKKEVVLLYGPSSVKVPRGETRDNMHAEGRILDAMWFEKLWDEEKIKREIKEAFATHFNLQDMEIELLIPCNTKIVKPRLGKGISINGASISTIWKQKPIYVRPSKEMLDVDRVRVHVTTSDDTSDDNLTLPDINLPMDFENKEIKSHDANVDKFSASSPHQLNADVLSLTDHFNTDQESSLHQLNTDRITSSNKLITVGVSSLHQFQTDQASSSHQFQTDQASSSHQFHTDQASSSHQFHTDQASSSHQFHTDQASSSHQFQTNQTSSSDKATAFYESDVYIKFLNVLSENDITDEIQIVESDDEKTENPTLVDSDEAEEKDAAEILKKLAECITDEKVSLFNVNRTKIIEGAIIGFKRKNFQPNQKISVCFTDDSDMAEGAIDEGGPKREFLRLLTKELFSSCAFMGPATNKFFDTNTYSESMNYHYYSGLVVALSLVHGGPGPRCLSKITYQSLFKETSQLKLSIDDIQDYELQDNLYKFKNAQNLEDLQKAETRFSRERYFSGSRRPVLRMEDKDLIIKEILEYCVVTHFSKARERFIVGLQALDVYKEIGSCPKAFEKIFCFFPEPLTANKLLKLCGKVQYSAKGSNKYQKEVEAMTHFRNYVFELEDGESNSKLEDLLIFATGADSVPPMSFDFPPSIEFSHDDSTYPTAHTCSMTLHLPVVHTSYEIFKQHMETGIQSFGFSLP